MGAAATGSPKVSGGGASKYSREAGQTNELSQLPDHEAPAINPASFSGSRPSNYDASQQEAGERITAAKLK